MHVRSIEVHNYKGFKDATIEFHPNLNVFIGSNASGKTTLLTAIIKSIYNITKNFVINPELNRLLDLSVDEINYKTNNCQIVSAIENFPDFDGILYSTLLLAPVGFETSEKLKNKTNLQSQFVKWYRQMLRSTVRTVPIFKYFPANRGSVNYQERFDNSTFQISQLEAWGNIYENDLSYSKFFNWFFDNETNELRLQRDSNDFTVQSPELKGVRLALAKTFQLLRYGKVIVKSKQIKRGNSSRLTPTLVLEDELSGKTDELDSKSDGEKAIITLISDIAYNLSLAKDFTVEDDFLKSPGIVVIDEIESHLHPNWQRTIIPILAEVFPNIQFFIATHSPQVVSAVNSESIYVCENFVIEKIKLKTKGEDSNSLLRCIFNSTERPLEYIALVNEIESLMEGDASYHIIEQKIDRIAEIETEDKSTEINSLVDRLRLQLEAYKFDKEHEANK